MRLTGLPSDVDLPYLNPYLVLLSNRPLITVGFLLVSKVVGELPTLFGTRNDDIIRAPHSQRPVSFTKVYAPRNTRD